MAHVNRTLAGFVWIGLYLLIVLVPVFLMLVPPVPSGRGFWLELSIALGFVGLTQIAVQFILIARFKRVTAPYGIDIILRYHRQIAVVALLAVLLHPAIIVIDNPSRLKLLNPLAGNWASRAGLLSVAVLVTTVLVSIFRERLRLDYERWRGMHIVLGVLAILLAQLHVSMAGLYTNTIWKQVIWVGTAALMVGLVIWLRVLKPAQQRNFSWRVAEVREELGDTHTLALEPVEHEGLRFEPGQFAWIKLAKSPFTLEEHPFSFSSSAEQRKRIEFGIKALGDFSSSVAQIEVGTRAYVDGPHGAFSIDRYQAPGYVLYAGGVGITPFMSFLRTMADRGDPRPVLLFYADKKLDDAAYREEIAELENQVQLKTVYVIEEPPDDFDGESGLISKEMLERLLPEEGFDRMHFICGPPAMMDAVHEHLEALEISRELIQLERFALA